MGFAMTILNKEEAMKLPPRERPLCYRLPEPIFNAIHQAIGEASMCWKPRPGKEVFNSEQASKVAFELCHVVADALDEAKKSAPST
jgi:hypothetical protein